MIKGIIFTLIESLLALIVICLVIYGEYNLLSPFFLEKDYTEWLIIILISSFFGLVWVNGKIAGRLLHFLEKVKILETVKNPNYRGDSVVKNNKLISKADATTNPSPIIPKPLGGYNRKQLNEIYLLGILIHQIYYSVAGENFTERLQRKALNIQMRFFITVFPQRNVNEYFVFTENFLNKNEVLCNHSVSECVERSIRILSTCNYKQIRKLKGLYKALTTSYSEVGGGNTVALITFSSMLDTELSSLSVEYDLKNC